MTIVLSSEDYSCYHPALVKKFSSFLTKVAHGRQFQVKVIITYREWLSHLYSLYDQRAKIEGKVVNTNEFSEYLLFGGVTATSYMDKHVETWGNQFGRGNMILADYYGAEGAQRDIAHVFICDIMGFFCDRLQTLSFGTHDNFHWNPVYVHFINVLEDILATKRMAYCGVRQIFNSKFANYLISKNVVFPSLSSNADILTNERIRIDKEVHNKYQMIRSNRTINEEKIRSFKMERLDVSSLLKDVKWLDFIDEEVKRLVSAGFICHLGGTDVVKEDELHLKK
jgi:hypothetical protein